MKIFFHHITGKMTDMSLIYANAYAEVEENEEDHALKNGWAVDEWTKKTPRLWFQARQVRLKVSELKYNKKTNRILRRCPSVSHEIKSLENANIDELQDLYDRYMKHRGFSDDLGALSLKEEIDKDKKIVFQYYDEGVLRAFTLLRTYSGSNSMTGLQFCWDYHKPSISLGKYSIIKEIEYAKENGMDYLYMMSGYEETCIYKRDFTGFEFWDGEKWSSDKKVYEYMCRKDSEIKTFEDMNKLMWEHEKNYFGI